MDIIKYFYFDRDEYSAREVTEIIAKDFDYDITGYTSNTNYLTLNNFLTRRLKATALKLTKLNSSSGINKQYSRKTNKGEVFDVAVVKSTIDENLDHLLKYYFRGDAADRLLISRKNAEKLNSERDWGLYADGNYDCISNDEDEVEQLVKEEKIKIVVEYIFETFLQDKIIPLPSTNEVSQYFSNASTDRKTIENQIDKILWDRKVEIAINYVCNNFIDIDENQLRHDIGADKNADDNSEYDSVMALVIDRRKNLKDYYKIRK